MNFHFRTKQAVVGNVLNIADPELVKLIFVKDFNIFNQRFPKITSARHPVISKNLFGCEYDLWKRIRPVVSPTFTSGKMKKMYPLIDDCLKHLIDNLESHVQSGKELVVKDVFGCLTMDVIAKCAFGTDTNANKDKNNPFIVHGRGVFQVNLFRVLIVNLIPSPILKILKIRGFFASSDSNEFFLNVARHIIKNRRENNERREDFLQILIDCQDAEKVNNEKNSQKTEIDAESHYVGGSDEHKYYKQLHSEKPLSDDEVIAQAWVFFIAGFETTASTLSYCTYELAVNQHVQDKLYKEIKAIENEHGSIDYETLAKLPYLDAVVSETLRKYPPVARLQRHASQSYQLGNTGIKLDKGSMVNILVYVMHHSEEYFPSPEQFKPERFLPENRDQIKPYTYLPFGIGPRNCVGMRFGLLETKLALAKIITKYKFVKSPNTQVPLEFLPFRPVLTAKSIIVGVDHR